MLNLTRFLNSAHRSAITANAHCQNPHIAFAAKKNSPLCDFLLSRVVVGLLLVGLVLFSSLTWADTIIDVAEKEDGTKTTGITAIWHDPEKNKTLEQAVAAVAQGEFKPLESAGSTGLAKGAFWSHFAVRNTTSETLRIQFEYVDHQLIALQAYDKSPTQSDYQQVADLSLYHPFSQRKVTHNRFVFEVVLAPLATNNILVKFSSEHKGYVYPSMRIWQPDALKSAQAYETSMVTFLFGGFFVMSLFSLVAGVATGGKMFYAYSVYSLSKITVWATILGYTHHYLITSHYHWNYMTMSGAVTIFCGLFFARIVLQSRRYTPKLDKVLCLMLLNSVLLFTCGLLRLNAFAVMLMTVAFLLYPTLAIVSFRRWRQGSTEALILGLAWSFLIVGLSVQALRDMGFVAHNYINYYWTPVASFTEMLTVMVAMGIRVKKLQTQKDEAENNYRQQMESSKSELEDLVQARTKELDQAKKLAEFEARTDPLTGIHNRRNFLALSNTRVDLANRKNLSICMLMLDIDHFKSINDTHGHNIGDAALLTFTREISNTVRESDIFGRVGGEEFALLLHEEKFGALELAERIREKIENLRLGDDSTELAFTVSIGLATFDKNDTVDSLMKKADMALYSAKENGRNCVIEYSESSAANSAAQG